ncbi:43623_t:CDS:2 [Gigaspora margarita]|uniref:43623_t:CDS:1 n=1 Tax=Gigaspora margarita TaxID=4874 RepID=A0ABN7VH77_GIGMA|nr:43623_t:CDS:2 [Gigaspora margarita]
MDDLHELLNKIATVKNIYLDSEEEGWDFEDNDCNEIRDFSKQARAGCACNG